MTPGVSSFGLTVKQLEELVELQGSQHERANATPYDGPEGVLRKLDVLHENQGIDGSNTSELEERRAVFGKNQWSRTQIDRQMIVLRTGKLKQILIIELVVGDVCPLNIGTFR
jgi:hypothetical protein